MAAARPARFRQIDLVNARTTRKTRINAGSFHRLRETVRWPSLASSRQKNLCAHAACRIAHSVTHGEMVAVRIHQSDLVTRCKLQYPAADVFEVTAIKPRRYAELLRHLHALAAEMTAAGQTARAVTFHEIEAWAGTPLPRSAYAYRAWWSNNSSNDTNVSKPWEQAGFVATDVDMAMRSLFLRLKTDAPQPRHPLRGALKGTIRIVRDAASAEHS
jgi:hypothetical protein